MNDNKITMRNMECLVSSLLIGSIGTVVETSQLQLEAFNGALRSSILDGIGRGKNMKVCL